MKFIIFLISLCCISIGSIPLCYYAFKAPDEQQRPLRLPDVIFGEYISDADQAFFDLIYEASNETKSVHVSFTSDDGKEFNKLYTGTYEQIRQELIKDGIVKPNKDNQ